MDRRYWWALSALFREHPPTEGVVDIIDHMIYHTSLDVPELVPATGLERSTRAFAAALDRANKMTMKQLRGTTFPLKSGQGSLTGTQLPNK